MPQSESKHLRPSSCGTMSDTAREQLLDIKDDIELFFKKLARKNKIKVVRGQRGNIPRAYHAVDFLLRVWDGLAPEYKAEKITEYATGYLETIKTQDKYRIAPQSLNLQIHADSQAGVVDE